MAGRLQDGILERHLRSAEPMTRDTPTIAYDDDFYAWTQEQADAVRRLPAGTSGIDIEHVAGEIADLGKRDLREVSSYLRRLIEHLVKIEARPDSLDGPHWRSEARHFQISAATAFTPSMRRLLDIDHIWSAGEKLTLLLLSDHGVRTRSIPCPFGLDDLLAKDFDLDAALARLAAAKSKA